MLAANVTTATTPTISTAPQRLRLGTTLHRSPPHILRLMPGSRTAVAGIAVETATIAVAVAVAEGVIVAATTVNHERLVDLPPRVLSMG
jgi:hypothetical protein